MHRVPRLLLAALLALAPAALAEAPEALLQHHGRLLGATNAPVTGTKPLRFALFHEPSGGDAAWSDTRTVDLDASGTYALTLGDSTDGTHPKLPWNLFDAGSLFLSVTIDGVELSPRLPLVDVPTASLARKAITAENVECEGCILPAALAGGITADKLQPIPIDQVTGDLPGARLAAGSVTKDKLASGGCTDGQLLKWNVAANAWDCAADVDTSVTAGDGLVLDAGALSIGSGAVTAGMLSSNGCVNGEVLKWNAATQKWSCAPDVANDFVVGAGLDFSGGTLSIPFRGVTASMLGPSGCADGELLKWNVAANAWLCAPDVGHDYVAGTGLTLSGSTFSIGAGSIGGSMLAPATITPDKLAVGCGDGQVLKVTSGGWACGTDLVGTSASGGLSQVAVTSPLTGDGTSARAIALADGGIVTAKLAAGAVTAAKLDGSMRTVRVVAATSSTGATASIEVDGTALTPAPGANAMVSLVIFDASGAPTLENYTITSPTAVTPVITRLDGLAAGTSALVIGIGVYWFAPGNAAIGPKLLSYGFPEAARFIATTQRPLATDQRVWVGAMVAGVPRQSVEWMGAAGTGSRVVVDGWLLGGHLVTKGEHPASLVDLNGSQLLSQPGDNSLALVQGQTLQVGYGVTKEANAGKIGYQTFSDALDIVGAGTTGGNRKIKLWGEGGTTTTGDLSVGGSLSVGGTIEQAAWTAPTYATGYGDYLYTYAPAGYFRDRQGMVHLRGLVKPVGGATSGVLFNLPAGHRPEGREIFMGSSYGCGGSSVQGAPVRVDVEENGNVEVISSGCQWVSLAGISFRAQGY